MDLITLGIITGAGYLMYESIDLIRQRLDLTTTKWNKLMLKAGLEKYKLIDKKITNTGYQIKIEVPTGGTTSELENLKEHIEKSYKCKCIIEDVQFSNLVSVDLITKEIEQQEYKPVILPATSLLLGYDFRGDVITVDMLSTPHLLISGLSGQGKTGLCRILINNLENTDKVLINGFKDDYKGIKIRNIIDLQEIKDYISTLLDDIEEGKNRIKPLYIILEELGKVKDKELVISITKLLQYGRHNNIYVIGIIQIATKEELKFKSYFNTRVSFRQLDSSSYQVALGTPVDKDLSKREFYVVSTELKKGRTFNLEY